MAAQYIRSEGQWFDENLNPAYFADEILGKMVIMSDGEDIEMFIMKEMYMGLIEYAPDGCVLEITDDLDTSHEYGVA